MEASSKNKLRKPLNAVAKPKEEEMKQKAKKPLKKNKLYKHFKVLFTSGGQLQSEDWPLFESLVNSGNVKYFRMYC